MRSATVEDAAISGEGLSRRYERVVASVHQFHRQRSLRNSDCVSFSSLFFWAVELVVVVHSGKSKESLGTRFQPCEQMQDATRSRAVT